MDQIKRINASLLKRGDLIVESERPLDRIFHRSEHNDVLVWREQDKDEDSPWDIFPEGKYVTIYRPSKSPVCPDGGTCHHECQGRDCFRVDCCEPLSDVYVDDKWPEGLAASSSL
jgi:hypothetical protein